MPKRSYFRGSGGRSNPNPKGVSRKTRKALAPFTIRGPYQRGTRTKKKWEVRVILRRFHANRRETVVHEKERTTVFPCQGDARAHVLGTKFGLSICPMLCFRWAQLREIPCAEAIADGILDRMQAMWAEADPYLYRVNPQLYNLANESKLAGEDKVLGDPQDRRSTGGYRAEGKCC